MGITIKGHSDDIVSYEEDTKDGVQVGDEITADDTTGVTFIIGLPEPGEGEDTHGIRVQMKYGTGGVWTATIGPIEEGAKCPWPVSVRVEGYTAVVHIDCPEGTPVMWTENGDN